MQKLDAYCIIMKADNSKIFKEWIPETSDGTTPWTYLGLVDRKIRRDCWWTDHLNSIIKFQSKRVAEETLAKLKYGNPEIVPFRFAIQLITHWWYIDKNEEVRYHPLIPYISPICLKKGLNYNQVHKWLKLPIQEGWDTAIIKDIKVKPEDLVY